jgi:hypothetical protein
LSQLLVFGRDILNIKIERGRLAAPG